MAQRRMFSKTITSSSQFLMMPQSSQNLYFHLGMNADDDGFCEHFAIMRMTDSKPDDLRVLSGKGFVNVFDEKVLLILDWKENNYLRSDRYTPSKYLEVYKQEIAELSQIKDNVYKLDTTGIPNVHQMDTQVRVGKDRIVEGSSRFAPPTLEEVEAYCLERSNKVDSSKFVDFYTSKGWMVGKTKMKDWRACIRTWEKESSSGRKDGNTITLNDGTVALLRFGNWVDSSTNVKLDRNYYKELP